MDPADAERDLKERSGLTIGDLWREAEAQAAGLETDELASALLATGLKYNWGQPAGVAASRAQAAAFLRTLHLRDLALAQACVLGREVAWQQFMARFREPLTQAAMAIAGSAGWGQELADSLYSEMFGVTERGQRRSPLAFYSGRGSLMGFLRATLAQRNVDHHRRSRREASLLENEPAATAATSMPSPEVVTRLRESLKAVLSSLQAEDRFLLSAWFLDQRTLLEISRLLRVHEATVSRRISRLTARLHKDLLGNLQTSGMSRAAAAEALGTDPRDIDVNLRSLLQTSQPAAFPQQGARMKTEQG